jgi:type IV pilus assembly protein PilO
MEKYLEQFSKIPTPQKVALGVVVVLMIAAMAYFMSVSESLDKIAENQTTIENQDTELLKLRQQADRRDEFQREVDRLKQRLREAEEQLPKSAELAKVLKDVDYEARQAGLRVDRFAPEAEISEGDFSKVPLKMTVRGGYHEVALFLDRLAKLPRIVNVTDLTIGQPKLEKDKMVMVSSYTATTYRFLESESNKPAGVTAEPVVKP